MLGKAGGTETGEVVPSWKKWSRFMGQHLGHTGTAVAIYGLPTVNPWPKRRDFLEVTEAVTGRTCPILPRFFKPHLPAFSAQGSQRKTYLGFRPIYATHPQLRTRVLCHLQLRPGPRIFCLLLPLPTPNLNIYSALLCTVITRHKEKRAHPPRWGHRE